MDFPVDADGRCDRVAGQMILARTPGGMQKSAFVGQEGTHNSACRINASASYIARFELLGFMGRRCAPLWPAQTWDTPGRRALHLAMRDTSGFVRQAEVFAPGSPWQHPDLPRWARTLCR